MNMRAIAVAALAVVAGIPVSSLASPQEDLKEFRAFYKERFPQLTLEAYRDGSYAIDADAHSAWQSIEEFPPYQAQFEHGQTLFETPFANGKTYASCFRNGGIGIRQDYPRFDPATGDLKTLELEINECRAANGEKPLDLKKGDMAEIVAYMASTSNGKKLAVTIPDDPRAIGWYEKGKEFFFQKRGQLNLSCANCHMDNAGNHIRSELLSPALGHPAHFPTFRAKWGELGTLHRRYGGCNEQVRAKAFKPQSKEYRALEYYQTYMSNGVPVGAPAFRK